MVKTKKAVKTPTMIPAFLAASSSSCSFMLVGKPLVAGEGAGVGALVVMISMLVTTTEYVPGPALCATEFEIASVKAELSAAANALLTFAGLLAPMTGVTPGIVIT